MNKNKDENSFTDLKFSEKIIVGVSITLLMVLALSFAVGIFFFGFAGLFRIFGVHYDSIYSLIFFVIIYFILALVFDFVSLILFHLMALFITGKHKLFFGRMILDCLFSWFVFHTVDEVMNSITIPLVVEVIVVIIFFFIEEALDDKKEKKVS